MMIGGRSIRPTKDGGMIVDKKEEETAPQDDQATIHVPVKSLGLLIGPQGATIKAIQTKTGTKINTPKTPDSEAVLITGPPEGVAAARRAIEQLLSKGVSQITHPGSITSTLHLAEESQIGIVIGPKGANIRKIQDELKVKIQMPTPGQPKLPVLISGDKENAKKAKAAIQSILNHGYSSVTHPGWILVEVDYPSSALGKLIGPRGQMIKGIMANTGCRINIPKPEQEDYKKDIVTVAGPANMVERARKVF